MPQRKIIKTELKLEDTVITKTVIYTEKVKKKDFKTRRDEKILDVQPIKKDRYKVTSMGVYIYRLEKTPFFKNSYDETDSDSDIDSELEKERDDDYFKNYLDPQIEKERDDDYFKNYMKNKQINHNENGFFNRD